LRAAFPAASPRSVFASAPHARAGAINQKQSAGSGINNDDIDRMATEAMIPDLGFDPQQQQWLQGYFAGLSAVHGGLPFVGHTPGGLITNQPAPGITNAAEPPRSAEPAVLAEQSVYGTPVSELCEQELCEQELWKLEQHGLDAWDKLLQHADEDKFPDKADTFRFRIETNGGLTSEAANEYVQKLKGQKRYQRDVY
jgi:hypothetical protein